MQKCFIERFNDRRGVLDVQGLRTHSEVPEALVRKVLLNA